MRDVYPLPEVSKGAAMREQRRMRTGKQVKQRCEVAQRLVKNIVEMRADLNDQAGRIQVMSMITQIILVFRDRTNGTE